MDRGKVERMHGHVIYWWEGGEEGGWREKEAVDLVHSLGALGAWR